jgi:hypothetical protein
VASPILYKAQLRLAYAAWERGKAKAALEAMGKTLACWCKPEPCQGDALASLAEELVGPAPTT